MTHYATMHPVSIFDELQSYLTKVVFSLCLKYNYIISKHIGEHFFLKPTHSKNEETTIASIVR